MATTEEVKLPAELEATYEAAYAMIGALCRPAEPGGRRWVMSIPARPDYDPDLVISKAVRDLRDALVAKVERDELGHGIAYDAACSCIESNCLTMGRDAVDVIGWFNVHPDALDLEAEDYVAEMVQYLEMRGLLERHPENQSWVRLRDESEATA